MTSLLSALRGAGREPALLPAARETASWESPCPGCGSDARWDSAATRWGVEYALSCPECGPCAWRARGEGGEGESESDESQPSGP